MKCRLFGGAAIWALLQVALPASAQWKDWDYDLDQEKKPWEELQAQLPTYPKSENLLKFDTGANTSNSYFVDAASLSVGEDQVVRYTLVVKTGGGATNVSFEGIHCDKGRLRVYAFGHANSQWSRARDSNWRPIVYREVNGHHNALYREYMCTRSRHSEPRNVKQIIATLKSGAVSIGQ
jgi:CNP1-like family